MNYSKKGCKTIYLGASMVLDALPYFNSKATDPTYITYITVQPIEKELPSFLKKFNRKVAKKEDVELWVLGHLAQKIKPKDIQSNQTVFKGISEVIDRIPQLIES